MKKNTGYSVQQVEKEIVITKEFGKRASIHNTPEYKTLLKLRQDNPDFSVVYKTVQIKKSKETHKGLTYGRMEEHIRKQPDGENNIIEFEKVKAHYSSNCRYAKVKKWFLSNFKDYNDDYVSDAVDNPEDTENSVDSENPAGAENLPAAETKMDIAPVVRDAA